MKNSNNIDLSGTLIELQRFPKSGLQNADAFLAEKSHRVYEVHDYLKKIYLHKTIVQKSETEPDIKYLHDLILQISQLQELLMNIECESIHINRMEFTLDDMIDVTVKILKELKSKKLQMGSVLQIAN